MSRTRRRVPSWAYGAVALALSVCAYLTWGVDRPKLHTIHVGAQRLRVEIADTPLRRQRGLMGRRSMPEDRGMLFIFHGPVPPERAAFWMKDTTLPLSIAFIGEDGRIFQVEDMRPLTTDRVRPRRPVIAALEVNRGWFERNGVGPGDLVPEALQR